MYLITNFCDCLQLFPETSKLPVLTAKMTILRYHLINEGITSNIVSRVSVNLLRSYVEHTIKFLGSVKKQLEEAGRRGRSQHSTLHVLWIAQI